MCKVSVIIPVYNGEKYLEDTLKSVSAQTLSEIEILCVDDGSTDHSWEILQQFAAQDSRIVLLKQKNAGAGAARNYGLKTAKGKYIAFIDSDDLYPSVLLPSAGSSFFHQSNGRSRPVLCLKGRNLCLSCGPQKICLDGTKCN